MIYPFDADMKGKELGGIPPANALPTVAESHHDLPTGKVYALPAGKMEKLTEEEKQKRLNALHKAKEHGGKQLKHIDDNIIFDSRYSDALLAYDKNGDGELDVDEILQIHQDMNHRKEQADLLKKILAGVILALLMLLLINGLLTFWVIKLTKDTKVSDDNGLTSTTSAELLKTEKPRYYTTLTDLPKLPAAALNSLNRLSFTTSDGGVHNYEVQGIQMTALNASLATIYFINARTLTIKGGKGVFTYLASDGTVAETDLVVDATTPITTSAFAAVEDRRLQMLRNYKDEGKDYQALLERCSITQGVCYHTYDEIMDLHNTPVHGRRLTDTSAVTYAEISADVAVLTKDNRSGLEQAKSYLENVLGKYATDGGNGAVIVSFNMKERCANYVTLREYCKYFHAPLRQNEVDYQTFIPPFRGLEAEDSLWWFTDEIEYWKDPYTIMLKVRYAHDILSDRRKHVVMMDRAKPSHVVTYDEVESLTDPKQPGISFTSYMTFIVNYKEEAAVTDDSVGIISVSDSSTTSSSRRLEQWDDAEFNFHQHIRNTKLFGFPRMLVADELFNPQHSVHKDAFTDNQRRLSENVLSVDSEVAVDGLYSLMQYADAANATTVTSAVAQSLLPAGDVDSNAVDAGIPTALFSGLEVSFSTELIKWPTIKDITNIDEFTANQIPQRISLALLREADISAPQFSSNRRLAELSSKHKAIFTRAETHANQYLSHRQKHREKISKQMEDMSQGLKALTHAVAESASAIIIPHGRELYTAPASRPLKSMLSTKQTSFQSKQIEATNSYVWKWVNSNPTTLKLVPVKSGTYSYPPSTTTCATITSAWLTILQQLVSAYDNLNTQNYQAKYLDISLYGKYHDLLAKYETMNTLVQQGLTVGYSAIPGIGSSYSGFASSLDALIKNKLTPAKNALAFSKSTKIISIPSKMKMLEMNTDLLMLNSDKLWNPVNTDPSSGSTHEQILVLAIVDKFCPSTTAATSCSSMTTTFNSVSSQLKTIVTEVTALAQYINDIAKYSSAAPTVFNTYNSTIFADVNKINDKLRTFLNRNVEVQVPLNYVWDTTTTCANTVYACGGEVCSSGYCFVKWCSAITCSGVQVPYATTTTYKTTFATILNGVDTLVKPIETGLKTMVENEAKLLQITFPTLPSATIPTPPSISLIAIASSTASLLTRLMIDGTLISPMKGIAAMMKSIVEGTTTPSSIVGWTAPSATSLPTIGKCV